MRNNIKINIKGLAILGIASLPFLGNAQDTSYKIGINTDTPNATLHIVGENTGNDAITKTFEVSHGADNATRNILFTAVDNGRVGIGVENPQADLHIKGDGINPAILLENTASLTKATQSLLPINYANSYVGTSAFGYIGDGSANDRRMVLVANDDTAKNILRSESNYGNGDYSEILIKKTDMAFNIRKDNVEYSTAIKNNSWKVRAVGSTSAVDTSISMSIEGAMVLGDGGYDVDNTTTPPAEGTMIFSKTKKHFYVYTNAGWKQLDNN